MKPVAFFNQRILIAKNYQQGGRQRERPHKQWLLAKKYQNIGKKVGNIIVLAKKLPKMNRWRTGGTPTQAGTLGSWRHCSTQHVCHKSFTLSGLKLIFFSGKYFVQWRLLPIVEYHEDIPSSRQKLINTWKIQKSASHLNRHEVLLIGQQRWAQCRPS